jgi:hypothetical protein
MHAVSVIFKSVKKTYIKIMLLIFLNHIGFKVRLIAKTAVI